MPTKKDSTTMREQMLAFRLHGHGLTARRRAADLLAAASACGLRNTPPGSAALALGARVADLAADGVDRAVLTDRSLVEVLSLRASPLLVPVADVPVFTVGALPTDEASMRVALVNHTREMEAASIDGLEALKLASAAAHDVLADGPMARGALSAAVTASLPPALSSRCEACKSNHVREMLFRLIGVAGTFVIVREGKETRYVRADQWLGQQPAIDPEVARLDLARRYLRCFGPSTPEHFAGWVGIATPQARATWDHLRDELVEVPMDKATASLLAADLPRFSEATMPSGVRLLPPYDAYLDQRDRATLVPDKSQQKRIWRTIGNPGALLVDGQVAGIWRPQKKGKRLLLTIETFGVLTEAAHAGIEAEAALLAPLRGCTNVEVTISEGAA